jgi:hypothetical protein
MGESLVVPANLDIKQATEKEFADYMQALANQSYNKSGVVGRFIDPTPDTTNMDPN